MSKRKELLIVFFLDFLFKDFKNQYNHYRTVGSGNSLPSELYRGLSEACDLVMTLGQFHEGQKSLIDLDSQNT